MPPSGMWTFTASSTNATTSHSATTKPPAHTLSRANIASMRDDRRTSAASRAEACDDMIWVSSSLGRHRAPVPHAAEAVLVRRPGAALASLAVLASRKRLPCLLGRNSHSRLETLRPIGGIVYSPLGGRSEEHTSELQSLMRISYAVFCLKKKTRRPPNAH